MHGNYNPMTKAKYKRLYELSLKIAINIYQRAFNQTMQGISPDAIKDDSLSFSTAALAMLKEDMDDMDLFKPDEDAIKEHVILARDNVQKRVSTFKSLLGLYEHQRKRKYTQIEDYLDLMEFYDEATEDM